MRLTVGPLPPAVYWRRRAVVIGALLLVVMVFAYSCGGSGRPGARAQGNATTLPTTTVTVLTPTTGSPEATEPAGDQEPTVSAAASTPTAPASGPCADEEMAVVPMPAHTTWRAGQPLNIGLRIKNVSSRTCSRDVGADLQELRIVKGATAEKIWSSDDCGAARGTDLRSFAPDGEREYMVTWNGRASTTCASAVPFGSVPAPGEYRVFGRLGTKLSDPVKLTLT